MIWYTLLAIGLSAGLFVAAMCHEELVRIRQAIERIEKKRALERERQGWFVEDEEAAPMADARVRATVVERAPRPVGAGYDAPGAGGTRFTPTKVSAMPK